VRSTVVAPPPDRTPNQDSPSSELLRWIFGVVAVRTIVCWNLHSCEFDSDKRIIGTDSSHRLLLSKTYSVISDAHQLSLGLSWEYEGIKWKVWILSAPEISNLFVPVDRHEQNDVSHSHTSAIGNQSPPKKGGQFQSLMSLISARRVQCRSRQMLRKIAAIPLLSCTRSTAYCVGIAFAARARGNRAAKH
jgi:hypothetical protein